MKTPDLTRENNTLEVSREAWLERHVERLLPRVRMARLDNYLGGDGSQTDSCEPEVIRSDIRATLKTQLDHPRDEFVEVLKLFYEIRDSFKPVGDEANRAAVAGAVQEWNNLWFSLTRGKSLGPSLAGISFAHCDLPGIDLKHADLGTQADRLPSDHSYANFKDASLDWSYLGWTDLSKAILENASLKNVSLTHANLYRANLRGADLEGADLSNANLQEADLTGAVLRSAQLTGADMYGATLDKADLLSAHGLMLDENSVYRTKFSNRGGLIWRTFINFFLAVQWLGAKFGVIFEHELEKRPVLEDTWSKLRRTYTGPNFIVTLLLLIAFVAPYFMKAFFLREIGNVEYLLLPKIESVTGINLHASPVSPEEMSAVRDRLSRQYVEDQRLVGEIRESIARTTVTVASFRSGCLGESVDGVEGAMRRLDSRVNTLGRQISDVRQAHSSLGQPVPPLSVSNASTAVAVQYSEFKQTLQETRSASQDLVDNIGRLGAECLEGSTKDLKAIALQTSHALKQLEDHVEASRNDVSVFASQLIRDRTYPIWQILLGLDTGQYGWTLLIILLFAYNSLKGFLTLTIAPMRDAEERGYITPAKLEYEKLLPIHRVVATLYFLSMGVGTYTVLRWMVRPVIKFW